MSVGEKELFAGLHGEMAARISTRASINTSHLTLVLLFAGSTLLSSFDQNQYNKIVIMCIIPLVSSYFVSLYIHNDRQIGLINHTLSKIENGSDIDKKYRFYAVGSKIGEAAFFGRKISNAAVGFLCLLSPALIVVLHFSSGKIDCISAIAFIFSLSISVINIVSIYFNSKFRQEILNWHESASFPPEK